MYEEKKDIKNGKNSILGYIEDLEHDVKDYTKDIEKFKNPEKDLEEYISDLINTITNFNFFFDTYYGIAKNDSIKSQNINYLQSILGMDFEIPSFSIYGSYEMNNTIFPLQNLIFSLIQKSDIHLDNKTLYDNLINTTNELANTNNIIYLKCYKINSIKDILNIYFNTFIEYDINLKLCKNRNKYFIPENRTDEVYCNRPSPQNPNKTCKEYSAKKHIGMK